MDDTTINFSFNFILCNRTGLLTLSRQFKHTVLMKKEITQP